MDKQCCYTLSAMYCQQSNGICKRKMRQLSHSTSLNQHRKIIPTSIHVISLILREVLALRRLGGIHLSCWAVVKGRTWRRRVAGAAYEGRMTCPLA